jgi:diacylglycerol kinase family enzyme
LRSLSRERLGKAKKYFGKWAREAPDFDCQLLLDDEPENGEFLLLQVANIGRIGPRLDLAPGAEPGDGYLDVVWVRRERVAQLFERTKKERSDRCPGGASPVSTNYPQPLDRFFARGWKSL